MDYIKKEKLNNAPIKKVSVALAFERLFVTEDDIKNFFKKTNLSQIFENYEISKALAVKVDEKSEITQDVLNGVKFYTKEKTKELFIEPNRAFYIDKNKYPGYENFIGGFFEVLNCFFQNFEKITIKELSLRYTNEFDLPKEKLYNDFYIYPCINLKKDNSNIAIMNNHLLVSNVQNVNYPEIFATIKTAFYSLNANNLLNIIFDIDTHMFKEYTLKTAEELNEHILKLKNFENELFFSNFRNVYELEEFN